MILAGIMAQSDLNGLLVSTKKATSHIHVCVRDATPTNKTKQSCLGNQDEGNFSCGTGWKVEVKKNFCFLLKNEW